MTITTSANKTVFGGTGAQTVFAFAFDNAWDGTASNLSAAKADFAITFTSAAGALTTVTQGAGSTQCQLALNAPVAPALWGLGGTVTYNPSGSPIAAGTSLTVLRTLPLTQAVSLQNQASFGQLASSAERSTDVLEMQIQQLAEAYGRAITVAVSDPVPLPLPPAAQRAMLGAAFDANGNMIAGAIPASGVISSAMAPVVAAATLAAAAALLGGPVSITAGLGNIVSPNPITGTGSVRASASLAYVFATDYGVTGDNTTDCTTFLQNAFNACATVNPAYSGAILLLPPGKIRITNTIVVSHPVTVRGVGKGAKSPLADPSPDIGASWITFDNGAFTGNALEFHTKWPVDLADFGVFMIGGSTTQSGILIDNKDGNGALANLANLGSRVRNVSIMGGHTQLTLLNCAAYDIESCFIYDFSGVGIVLANDGTGGIIDSGDARVRSNEIQCYANARANSTCILIQTQGGLNISANKLLGAQLSIHYDANVDGVTGEVDIEHNNIEASAVNAVRLSKSASGATFGGINCIGNHFNIGSSGPGDPLVQSVIAFVGDAGGNWVTRSKIIGNDFEYNNAGAGTSAIDLGCGDQVLVALNTFQIPADAHILSTSVQAGVVRAVNNGPVNGPTVIYGNLNTTTQVIDTNGMTVAQLGAWAPGSQVYATNAKRTSNTDPTVVAGGSGGTCFRDFVAWHTLQPG